MTINDLSVDWIKDIFRCLDITSKVNFRGTCKRFRTIRFDEEDLRLIKILDQLSVERSIAEFKGFNFEYSIVYQRLEMLKNTMLSMSHHKIQWPNLFLRIIREIHIVQCDRSKNHVIMLIERDRYIPFFWGVVD